MVWFSPTHLITEDTNIMRSTGLSCLHSLILDTPPSCDTNYKWMAPKSMMRLVGNIWHSRDKNVLRFSITNLLYCWEGNIMRTIWAAPASKGLSTSSLLLLQGKWLTYLTQASPNNFRKKCKTEVSHLEVEHWSLIKSEAFLRLLGLVRVEWQQHYFCFPLIRTRRQNESHNERIRSVCISP